MSVMRINEFQAREGEGEALRGFLSSIVPLIVASDGCRSCQTLQSQDEPKRFVVIEEWDSVEAHQASLKHIPAGTFKQAMDLLAAPPRGDYFTMCSDARR